MDEKKIQSLLSSDEPLTPEEEALLVRWYDQFEEHKELTFDSASHKQKVKETMRLGIFEGIQQALPYSKRKTISWPKWSAVAAAIILILSIGSIIYWMQQGLQFFDHSRIAYTEVTAPSGKENTIIVLPDSSKVWLMAGTTLQYPQQFEEHSRTVTLVNGMAYFEVTHNPNKEFAVNTPAGIRTTVLGTSFNISAFKSSDKLSVTVLTGKVQVSQANKSLGRIIPNQQIVYTKSSQESMQQEVDASLLTAWTQGNIVMQGANVFEVVSIIEQLYGVKVHFDSNALSALHFNFRFRKEDSLTVPLDMLRNMGVINYEINGNTVTLTPQ
jgi:transmembrane sensor